jgi:hypothetical protein
MKFLKNKLYDDLKTLSENVEKKVKSGSDYTLQELELLFLLSQTHRNLEKICYGNLDIPNANMVSDEGNRMSSHNPILHEPNNSY